MKEELKALEAECWRLYLTKLKGALERSETSFSELTEAMQLLNRRALYRGFDATVTETKAQ